MIFTPTMDVNLGFYMVYFTGIGLVGLALAVIIEAGVLSKAGWGKFRVCLVDSVVMNLVSTILGIAAVFRSGFLGRGIPTGTLAYILFWFVGYVGSVLIEGFVLWLRHARERKYTFLLSARANLVSYLVLTILFASLFDLI
jgi:hypothetical protein